MGIVKYWSNVLRDAAEFLSLQALQNNLERLVSETAAVHLILYLYRVGLNNKWLLRSLQALPLSYSCSSESIRTH